MIVEIEHEGITGYGEAAMPPYLGESQATAAAGLNSPEHQAKIDAMIGDGTLFIRGDETEASWRLFTPLLQSWQKQGREGMETYAAGSWGPAGGDALLAAHGHAWRNAGR